jgi:cytochrome c peroxidase
MRWIELRASPLLWAVSMTLAWATTAAAQEPLLPLPAVSAQDPERVELGWKLFSDTRFAKDNSVACVSCHSAEHGGADERRYSLGAGGAAGAVNAPSVWNASLNFRQQWAGGASSLEDVVGLVLANPAVFNSNWDELLAKLSRDAALRRDFKHAYPDGLTRATVIDALVSYQRTLLTPSRFDRYLQGDAKAISQDELLGYGRFKAYGCVGCHQGANVGGNMFQRLGVMGDYFRARAAAGRPVTAADWGRYNVTHKEEDRFVFKVPSLRNVALTAPYFHDGSARTLEDAVDVMFRYQLGREAPAEDKALIIKFLNALSGNPPATE